MATTESAHGQSAGRQGPPPTAARMQKQQQLRLSRPRRRPVDATLETLLSPGNLGWLSIALGASALLAPRPVARATGLTRQAGLLPLVGLRELASGVGLLTQQNGTPWLWSRVVGDVMDLAVISSALGSGNPHRARALGTAGVVGAIAGVDLAAAIASSTRHGRIAAGPFSEGLIVNKTPQECYEFWRDPNNLAKFSMAVESVAQLDDHHARWMLRGPLNRELALTVKITTDDQARRIAWRSVGRSDIALAGVARFEPAPGNRGTVVSASLWYPPPGGKTGAALASLVGVDPRSRLREDLRRFKQLIETGEIATTRGQPSGRRSLLARWIPAGSRQRS